MLEPCPVFRGKYPTFQLCAHYNFMSAKKFHDSITNFGKGC